MADDVVDRNGPIGVPSPRPRAVFDVENPPLVLGPADLAAVWGVSMRTIYRLIKAGEFDCLRTTKEIGTKPFSGILLARFLKGEPLYVPTFGRKRERQSSRDKA